jgi:DNA polymerase-1
MRPDAARAQRGTKTMAKKKRLFLMDGTAFIFRSFHAVRGLTDTQGRPTGAVFGFVNTLEKLIDEESPDYFLIAFDAKGPTFRHTLYPEYKANRPECPEDLVHQIPLIKDLCEYRGVESLEMAGYEADDIIGTLAKAGRKKGLAVVIVSGDKDMYQLMEGDMKILRDVKQMQWVTPADVEEQLGVRPDQVTDLYGIVGDKVDNIPGVPGIGLKGAADLISRFGSIDACLERIDQVEKKGHREKLEAFGEQARFSRQLFTIKTDLPLKPAIEDYGIKPPDREKLSALFESLDFASLTKKYAPESPGVAIDFKILGGIKEISKVLGRIRKSGRCCVDLETDSLNPMQARIVGIALAAGPDEAWYLPVGHKTDGRPQLELKATLAGLKKVLEDPKIEKIGQNIKYDWIILKRHGLDIRGAYWDPMVLAYLLDPSQRSFGLDHLARKYLKHTMITYEEIAGKGSAQKTLDFVPVDDVAEYSAEDAIVTLRLADLLREEIESKGLLQLYEDMEAPLIRVLLDMEMTGVVVDQSILKKLTRSFKKQLEALEKKIYKLAGEEFNINSPKQLGAVLFGKLKLPHGKKSRKTGAYSTSIGVLQELAKEYELPAQVIEYRQLHKLLTSYLENLGRLIDPDTGRVHTSFNQTVTATGRLSSSDPNLQNIPVRTEIGRKIREAFVADKGKVLLCADYSQIELRVLAHMSEDPTLIEAFKNDEDIHTRTAVEMFGVEPDDLTADHRRRAKAINFGIIYGMSRFGLSSQLAIPVDEAAEIIDRYFERYPGVAAFIEEVKARAEAEGFVKTLFGRVRYLPELTDQVAAVRNFGERLAVNTPIQGTAADLMKMAMVSIFRDLKKRKMASKMVIQVHDELIVEVPEDEIEAAGRIVRKGMAEVYPMKVPLTVDMAVGKNWLEAK